MFGPPACWFVELFWTELFESVVPVVVFEPVPAGNGEPDAGDCIPKSWFCPGVVFCKKETKIKYYAKLFSRIKCKNKNMTNPLYIFDEVMHAEMRIFSFVVFLYNFPVQKIYNFPIFHRKNKIGKRLSV